MTAHSCRVRLIKQLTPELPYGIEGRGDTMEITEGPWTAALVKSGDVAILNGDRVVICHAYKSRHISGSKMAANASLIAAAPELLESLYLALEWIDSVPQDTILPAMPGFDRDWVNDVIHMASGNTPIAKEM